MCVVNKKCSLEKMCYICICFREEPEIKIYPDFHETLEHIHIVVSTLLLFVKCICFFSFLKHILHCINRVSWEH